MKKNSGFSLLELLIVVAIILIIATIAIPSLLRSRQAAQESSAVSNIRTINTAEVTYLSSNAGNYGITAELAPVAGGGAPGDTCEAATAPTLGTAFDADTFRASDDMHGRCGGQGAADVSYRIQVTARSRIDVKVLSAEFNGAVYLRRGCAACG